MSKTRYYSPKLRVAIDFINEYAGDHDMRLDGGGGGTRNVCDSYPVMW